MFTDFLAYYTICCIYCCFLIKIVHSKMSLRFIHPFTCVVAGPSGSGKSVWITNLIRNIKSLSNVHFEKIIWCYGVWQPLYFTLQKSTNIEFIEGVTDVKNMTYGKPKLIIIDDLMSEVGTDLVDIFTKFSHHKNISVIFVTQNIFHKGKGSRDVSLNAHYFVVFKNPRDKAQFSHLARQVHPTNPKFLQEAYENATSRPHGYLLLDLKQSTPEALRYRSQIFPPDTTVIYREKLLKE
jgi:hypothetical protein